MLVWGSKSGVADLGTQPSRHCPVCERERSFKLMLQYKVSHLWHVIKWVSEKQYAVVCEVCQRGEKLATQAVEAKLGKPKLPTSSKGAWMAILASIAGLVILGTVFGTQDKERTNGYLAAPEKNDLYVLNVITLQQRPQGLAMYGVLRVRNVDGERVEFDTPTVAYEQGHRAKKDLDAGRYADSGYLAGERLVLTREQLAALRKSGAIYTIERPMKMELGGAGAKP